MNNDDTEKRLNPDADLSVDDTAAADTSDNAASDNTNSTDTSKSDSSDGTKHLTGYAVVFNTPSKDLGGFTEQIDPHAFDNVDLSDVYLTNNHDMSQVLASTKAGTLTLNVDDKGLAFDATLPDTTLASDTAANVDAGNISNMSFTFINAKDGDTFTADDNGHVTRTIKSIKSLLDVTLVAIPAYDDTNVQVSQRSLAKAKAEAAKIEAPENTNVHIEKRGANKMENTIIDSAKPETSAYEQYVRSQGEQRDGLTVKTAGAVVPTEIINEVWNLKQSTDDLTKLATVKQVKSLLGKYPVATVNGAVLATHEELAELGDIDATMFNTVKYELEDRAGKILLSNDLIEDSAVDIVATVKDQLKQLVNNTNNAEIAKVLQGFTPVAASNLDDVKQVVNVQLDPALSITFVVNQDCYNYLDTLKDSEGRYLLQPDVTTPSGKSLFGRPVLVVSNKLMPSTAGSFPMFAGDVAQSVFVAQGREVQTQWEKFDYDASGLAVVLRSDYEVVDPDAGRFITITPAGDSAAATTTTANTTTTTTKPASK